MPIESIVEKLSLSKTKDLDTIKAIMDSVSFDDEWLRAHTPNELSTETYHRDVLHHDNDYEIVLATWPRGIGTLPHNHGSKNSHGMVRVIKGEIFNNLYTLDDGDRLLRAEQLVHQVGEYIPVATDLIHAMGCHGDCDYSMSLHIYAPVIVNVSFWDPETLCLMKRTG